MTKKVIIADHFNLSMLDPTSQYGTPIGYLPTPYDNAGKVARIPKTLTDPKGLLDCWIANGCMVISAITNQSSAEIISDILQYPLEVNDDVSIFLDDPEIQLLVAQPCFPEQGTSVLKVQWWTL